MEEDAELQNGTQGQNAEHGDLPQFDSGTTKDRRLFLQRSVHVRENRTLLADRGFYRFKCLKEAQLDRIHILQPVLC